MIHSMTGYAIAAFELPQATLNLELRSVNSRFLDIHFRIPDELRAAEGWLREQIQSVLSRGKVDVRLSLQKKPGASAELAVNPELLHQLRRLQHAVHAELATAPALTVADILRWPGMLAEDTLNSDALQAAIQSVASAALADLQATRQREGERLAAMMSERIRAMRALLAALEPRIPQIVADYQEKLSAKLREAVDSLDEERIRQEIAVFAIRIDVAEEFSRLATHLTEVERVLKKGGAVGKRLDFLMQELNREANTLGSKSVITEQTNTAVELKILIEQMREQVQNLE